MPGRIESAADNRTPVWFLALDIPKDDPEKPKVVDKPKETELAVEKGKQHKKHSDAIVDQGLD